MLSIFIITIFDNNFFYCFLFSYWVVICFQFLLLRSLTTTYKHGFSSTFWLWFAFNFYYYDLWQQPCINDNLFDSGCDLLSIFIITIFDNNVNLPLIVALFVVICFQFLLLRSLTTTIGVVYLLDHKVVICFQFLLLRSLTTTNSEYNHDYNKVVICFQFLLLRSLTTTIKDKITLYHALWFAFNFYYYDLWQQLRRLWLARAWGCDLLSIFIITIFDNNSGERPINSLTVVICFQFLLLRSLTTTSWRR